MKTGSEQHGLVAAFASPEALLKAAHRARERGYTRLDAFSPFPIEGLAELVGYRGTRLPIYAFAGGVIGAVSIFLLQLYSVEIAYPINVGGRPLNAWPAFAIPAFECAILGAALVGFFGMLVTNGLPRLYHPVFNAASFSLAQGDRFYLLVGTDDPRFDRSKLRSVLKRLGATSVEDVGP